MKIVGRSPRRKAHVLSVAPRNHDLAFATKRIALERRHRSSPITLERLFHIHLNEGSERRHISCRGQKNVDHVRSLLADVARAVATRTQSSTAAGSARNRGSPIRRPAAAISRRGAPLPPRARGVHDEVERPPRASAHHTSAERCCDLDQTYRNLLLWPCSSLQYCPFTMLTVRGALKMLAATTFVLVA